MREIRTSGSTSGGVETDRMGAGLSTKRKRGQDAPDPTRHRATPRLYIRKADATVLGVRGRLIRLGVGEQFHEYRREGPRSDVGRELRPGRSTRSGAGPKCQVFERPLTWDNARHDHYGPRRFSRLVFSRWHGTHRTWRLSNVVGPPSLSRTLWSQCQCSRNTGIWFRTGEQGGSRDLMRSVSLADYRAGN